MITRLTALTLAAAIALPAIAAAQAAPPAPFLPRIVVSGEGQAAMRPDLALVSLAVLREAATAAEALSANSDAMAAVIAAMKAAGIADRDLQTAGIQINPRYNYVNKPDGTQEATLVAYQVTNTISVRVRDLTKTGEIIDQAVKLGVNQGGSITFTNEDPSSAMTDARKAAVADALAKARTLSEAAGTELGRVIEITEASFQQPPMPYYAKVTMEDARGGAPVEAGENAYRVQVNVTFELN